MNNKNNIIACVGDSITVGNPGVSYTKYLRVKRYKNWGLGGDTLLGVSRRVKEIAKNKLYKIYVLEVGTNDILLPLLETYSELWQKVVKRIIKRGSIPTLIEEDFINEYSNLLNFLLNLNAEVIVVNIPCFGEKIDKSLNIKVDAYNRAIKKLCEQLGVSFVDFNQWQREAIREANIYSDYFIGENCYKMISDSILSSFGFSGVMSKKRELVVTIDGIHLNHIGAKGLANLINDKIFD